MDTATLHRLIDQAQKDPAFFHALVFDPESAISRIHGLDDKAKLALTQHSVEAFIATLIGETQSCGGSETCSCTSGTCGDTCGGGTCGGPTCGGDSCGRTCDNSCGYTSNMQFGDWMTNVEADQIGFDTTPVMEDFWESPNRKWR